MSAFIPADAVHLDSEFHIIRFKIGAAPYPEIAVAPEGVSMAELRRLHAARRKRFLCQPHGIARIEVVADFSAPGRF